MANFQRIVLFIAVVLLIICLIIIGLVLVNSKNNQQWPPIVGDCPDYWVDTSGNGGNCINVKNLGKSPPSPMDFTSSIYTGSNGTCNKYKWATLYGLTWDGITYGVSNPCDTTDTTTTSS
jgi:uncharacterized membrane protein YdjX (TVP38/TMEM64 family)